MNESKYLSCSIKDLCLRDEVLLFDAPYGWGTVVRVWEEDSLWYAEVFRPYVHVGDFSYVGNRVLHYMGHETIILCGSRELKVDAAQRRANLSAPLR